MKRNTVLEFIISSGSSFHLSIVLTQKEFNLTDFNDLGFINFLQCLSVTKFK